MSTDEDRRLEASMEEWDADHPPDMRCDDCDATWWGNWTRGSRIDPPYPRNDVCPNCGA